MAGAMKYVGNGAFLVGVPSHDLTAEQVKLYGHDWLLASGLYVDKRKPRSTKPKIKTEDIITEDN